MELAEPNGPHPFRHGSLIFEVEDNLDISNKRQNAIFIPLCLFWANNRRMPVAPRNCLVQDVQLHHPRAGVQPVHPPGGPNMKSKEEVEVGACRHLRERHKI